MGAREPIGTGEAAKIREETADLETHMRHTVGVDAPTALCNTSITTGLTGDVAAVTCDHCRREAYRIIAEQEEMRRQAEADDDA